MKIDCAQTSREELSEICARQVRTREFEENAANLTFAIKKRCKLSARAFRGHFEADPKPEGVYRSARISFARLFFDIQIPE
jgi:hypothetical protein